jgi:biotin transporter BioY
MIRIYAHGVIFAYRYGLSSRMEAMVIVAIGWLYVVLMMSITERTAVAGVMTFLFYGVFPLTIVLYLMGTPQRKRNRQLAEKNKAAAAEAATPAESPDSIAKDQDLTTQ